MRVSALTDPRRPGPGGRTQGRPPQRPAAKSTQKPLASITPARLAAFEILERVATSSAHSDDLLYGSGLALLSQADKNLTTALVLGTLRWQIALDARIKPLLQRPELTLAQPVQTALRLGAFQLLHMDRIPAHAALSESVELARAAGHPYAVGMVNAVLRKLAAAKPLGQRLHESTSAFAERLGHPSWLAERWVTNYGRATALAICEYDQQEPRDGSLFSQEDTEEGGSQPRLDDGSRLVGELAAASVSGAQRIWDCCAAPGGKTLLLAQRHPLAELLATDVSSYRLRALAQRLQRDAHGKKVRTVEADASTLSEDEGLFDLILCDVPCSGTGTLARNPEIRHHLRPSDLARQAERQRAILSAALLRLAPGGRLIYSTCSLEPEENEQVVKVVFEGIKEKIGISLVSAEPVVAKLQGQGVLAAEANVAKLTRDGFLRTLPGAGFEGDGFFAAVFVRG
ncbi:16S rRNA (cytosine967-C5)-methyltransferase [Granulicella mallensis]|uniref:16S rRNA (Cytosine967-C5)-methyltransferase n=1 Tax=Granulicella mallensis TaxID=940614 RepID=A0A7W7ZQF9_9BACT|nr:16S rRNA (cytosine967-C5)-methyltransferase [Granulicella mallensis]